MKALKWIGIVIVVLVVMGMLLPDTDKTNDTVKEESTNVETSKDDIEIIKHNETATEMLRTVHVEVKNNTDKLLVSGQIKVIYTDKDENMVGTGMGTILNLAAGKTKVIDCIAMSVDGATNYTVQVDPLLYE